MSYARHTRGGAAVAALGHLAPWEAALIVNLRLWGEGPLGQAQIRREFAAALSDAEAERAWHDFDDLMRRIAATAPRPMVWHPVGCSSVGADECVFAHLVGTASAGHLGDAALIATLLVGAAHAEHVALLAGEVGTCARRLHQSPPDLPKRPGARLH